jgi:hypothetical protein
MPVVKVPANAEPGVLTKATMIGLDAICDVGSMAGVVDGSVSAWVQVCITPIGSVTPDAFGRFLHVVIEFAQPNAWRGKRRRQVPSWSTTDQPNSFFVECDPGLFWVGTWAKFWAGGGTPGDAYNVTMTVSTMQQEADALEARDVPVFYQRQVDVFEPACLFMLTAQSMADSREPLIAMPGPAYHHSRLRLVAGSASWGGVPLIPGGKSVPLNAPIVIGTSTIIQTFGGV